MGRNSMMNLQFNTDAISLSCGTRQRFLRILCDSWDGDMLIRRASSAKVILPDSTHCILIMSETESAVFIWSSHSNATKRAQLNAFSAILRRSSIGQLSCLSRCVKLLVSQPQRRATSFRDILPDLMHWILTICLIFMWWLLFNWWIDVKRMIIWRYINNNMNIIHTNVNIVNIEIYQW